MAAYEAWAPAYCAPGGGNHFGDVFGCAVTGAFRKTGDARRLAAPSRSAGGEPAGNHRTDPREKRNQSTAASGGTISKPRAPGRRRNLRTTRPAGGGKLEPRSDLSGAADVDCDRPDTGPGIRRAAHDGGKLD